MILRNRWFRLGGTIVVTGLAALYIVTKIDVGKTAHIIGSADPGWLALSLFLTVITVPPQAWRWRLLLRLRGIEESLGWLTRAYFVSYAIGQVLPTAVGGDASRIFETTRRHPGRGSPIAGSVLLERALGGAVTLVLAAVGLALAVGRYSIGAYLWIEALFVVLTVFAGFVLFSRRVRRHLRFAVPPLRRLRLDRPIRAAYEGIHAYREDGRSLVVVCLVTTLAQASRIVAIWASAEAVGIHLSIRPYIVLGPLLFLVMLVPFTVNGLGVREAFFVSFLGNLHVGADSAAATGFLFFVMTLLLAAPGLAIILWEGLRRAPASVSDA
jgi:glycosyltransferase 2 family protein